MSTVPAPRTWAGTAPTSGNGRLLAGGRRTRAERAGSLADRGRVLTALVLACGLLLALSTLPVAMGPGVIIVGVCSALTVGAIVLSKPVVAVLFLLLAMFIRLALPPVGGTELSTLFFAAAVAAVVLGVVRRVYDAPTIGATETAMVLLVLWNIASAVSPHQYAAEVPVEASTLSVWRFILTGFFIPFVMYVVGRTIFRGARDIRALLWLVIGLSGYSAIVSILPSVGLDALVWPRYIVEDPSWPGRAVGVLNQPMASGMLMALGFVAALLVARLSTTPRPARLLCYVVAAASVAGIYLTLTRAAWLAFAVVVVFGVVLARGFRAGFVVVLIAALLAVVVNWSTFTSDDREAGGVASTSEVDDRLNGFATSAWAIGEEPFAGWGVGRFAVVNTYHHKTWAPDTRWFNGFGISSHHTESGIAVELGLVGLAMWLAVVFLLGRRLYGAARRLLASRALLDRGFAIIAVVAFATWIVVGQTIDLRYNDLQNALVLLLVGGVVGLADRRPKATAVDPATAEEIQDLIMIDRMATGPSRLRHLNP